MLFNKATAIELVKNSLTVQERKQLGRIELALGACLDDLSNRIKSSNFMRSYDVTVASGDREETLSGNDEDLKYIFALQMGTGTTQRMLEWVDPQSFLRDYNASNASAADPTHFTILEHNSEGWPTVRFNTPTDGAETLKVYYWLEMAPNQVAVNLSVAPVVQGTLAYFYGTSTEKGAFAYERFKEAARLTRSSNEVNPTGGKRFRLPRDQKSILASQRNIKNSRRPS
jgi:hypothetical protein